jgi:hypothetical protein
MKFKKVPPSQNGGTAQLNTRFGLAATAKNSGQDAAAGCFHSLIKFKSERIIVYKKTSLKGNKMTRRMKYIIAFCIFNPLIINRK